MYLMCVLVIWAIVWASSDQPKKLGRVKICAMWVVCSPTAPTAGLERNCCIASSTGRGVWRSPDSRRHIHAGQWGSTGHRGPPAVHNRIGPLIGSGQSGGCSRIPSEGVSLRCAQSSGLWRAVCRYRLRKAAPSGFILTFLGSFSIFLGFDAWWSNTPVCTHPTLLLAIAPSRDL